MPAKRAYGMDQDFYPWSPSVNRPGLRRPHKATGGPEGLWSGNQPQFPDIGGYGNHEYGNRVGIFRILEVLDKHGITPTLALDKAVADHYPTLVAEGKQRGAEFIAHVL